VIRSSGPATAGSERTRQGERTAERSPAGGHARQRACGGCRLGAVAAERRRRRQSRCAARRANRSIDLPIAGRKSCN
jgi:hypothetical protein